MALGLTVDRLLEMRGKPVFDREGEKIGSIEDIYVDDDTREPEWVGLGMGFLGMKHAIVPLADASLREDGIAVPYEKDRVKDAPDAGGEDITAEKEAELARYYAISTTQPTLRRTSSTTMPPGEPTSTVPPAGAEARAGAEMDPGESEASTERASPRKYGDPMEREACDT